MPAFAYRAVHASGRVSRGEMSASNENELGHYLRQSGLELIDAREKKNSSLRFSFSRSRARRTEASELCARLSDLLQAGIPFADALNDVNPTVSSRVLADALTQISNAVADGKGIAASFGMFSGLFPPVLISIVAAGEASGDMAATFRFLSRLTKTRAETHERLRRALRYPLFLFLVAGGASLFMMTAVVPQIVQFLNGLGGRLPFATRALIATSSFIASYGPGLFASLIASTVAAFAARKISPSFALIFDRALLRLPAVGVIVLKTDIARFAQSFAILFRSGCDVSSCFEQANETVGNRALQSGIKDAAQRVHNGAALSSALEGVLPPFAVGALRVGERSGNIAKSLETIAESYNREAARAVDSFIGLLEPGLTLIVGLLLAWTVLATLGPLYGSLSVLGGRI